MTAESLKQMLREEEKKIDQSTLHKTAFRVAFDFLMMHYPPQQSKEYWLKVCDDIRKVSEANYFNQLCQELLSAVLVYLSNTEKDCENQKECTDVGADMTQ